MHIYWAWLAIRSANYATSGGGRGGGRAEQRMGQQQILAGAINLVGALLDVTLCCHEDLHVAVEGYISVRWLDLVRILPYCICTWHKGQIERRRRVPVRNYPPARGRGEDRYTHSCAEQGSDGFFDHMHH